MPEVRILVIDDDPSSQTALRHLLGSDEWYVEMAALPDDALEKLAAGGWNLVVANVSMSSLSGPLFDLLRQLAEGGGTIRVLFLVPGVAESRARAVLEKLKLPYATKPLQLQAFLEQVTELLHQAGAIPEQAYREHSGPVAPKPALKARARHGQGPGGPQMFASREDYYDYDEDELRRFEEEERRKAHGDTEDSQ